MNYRSKVLEINDFENPTKNPWSDRRTYFECLFRTWMQHISDARLIPDVVNRKFWLSNQSNANRINWKWKNFGKFDCVWLCSIAFRLFLIDFDCLSIDFDCHMWRSTGKRCFPENPETFLGYLRESCGELWEVPGYRKWKEIRIWLFWLIVKEFLYFMFGFVSFS